MDEFDRASEREAEHREYSINKIRQKNKPVKHTGYCLYCSDTAQSGSHFCSKECVEDYHKEQLILSRIFR